MNKSFSVGLDIGTTKIVAMVGERNQFNKINVLGVGKSQSLGVHRGVVNNITQTIQSIKIAIEEAQNKSNIEISEVAVGIAGQHIRSLQHSDYITRENPDEVINNDDIDKLIVKEAYVGKGLVMKRFHARARGRGAKIIKPFSRLTLVLEERL